MPIDFDGLHDCAPANETDGLSEWECPGCGKAWELHGNCWWETGTYEPEPQPAEPERDVTDEEGA
jgi:hypothetical protein